MGELKDKIRRSLDNACRKSPWHSMKAALEGITEAQASWEPQPYKGFPWAKGSIKELTYHVGLDKLVQASCAFGDGSLDWERARQMPEAQENTIAAAECLLYRAHEELLDRLDALPDGRLSEKVSTWGGKRMAAGAFFDMLTEHDIYHAGQIRYARNMIDAL